MYIPLNNKSNYTLLSSLIKISDLVSYAKDNKITSIGLCDSNMYGVMPFIKLCNDNNIKSIIGLRVILEEYSFNLYAKNYDGYKNLLKLSTIQNERLIKIDEIKKYSNDLVCILPFKSRDYYENFSNIYSNLYVGYSDSLEMDILNKSQFKRVFFRENLYINNDDFDTLTYLYYIRDGKSVSDECNYDIYNHSLNISNINSLTDNVGINNSMIISDMCNIEFPKNRNLLPIYECEDPDKYLFELCKVGLNKRLGGNVPDYYKNRLSHELNIITKMGFSNYFSVVYDFIKFAKKNGILVGPGRGSAAGSLVSFTLGITDIDPLKYNLLFERFLNPERVTMPDIDSDFPDSRRDEVISYVRNKYGNKRVAGIVTFGTLGAKQVIRDVGRILNIPSYKIDNLSHYIPAMTHDKLKDIYNNNLSFKTMIDSDISLKKLFSISCKIEGFPRHTSSHAAGIVMSQIDLDEVVPLTMGDNIYLTSYSAEYLEDLGLLKMDFLGLKNLTMISNIISFINKDLDDKDKINFSNIPLDDPDTFKIFSDANTCGIFQFESMGMRNFLKRLMPNSFEDIVAAIALYRPGANVSIDSYIERKFGREEVHYLDDGLKNILADTYGILIYQEQIMQTASIYAGYSLGEADILRRAMSKKKVDLLKNEEEKFVKGAIKLGHDENQAMKIFSLILNFAGYGFNKSHSVAYSIIAYKMAYLKCHYPLYFFANLLTNSIGSINKTQEYIMEAKSIKLDIVKPSINYSSDKYEVYNGKIIYPFSNIKSIGGVLTSSIIKARGDKLFVDIFDTFSRLSIEGVTKNNFETLIYAGVFDEFKYSRQTLINNLDSLLNYADLTKDIDPSLVMRPEIERETEYSQEFILEKEFNVFGFYLSSHPTTMYKKDNDNCILIRDVSKYLSKRVDVLVFTEKVKIINTKKGDKMAFITGSDETGSIEFTMFPKTYNLYSDIKRGDIFKVSGSVEKRYSDIQIIVERIKKLNEE